MLEMTNGVIKLLPSVFCLQIYPSQARHILLFLGTIFIIIVLQTLEPSTFSPFSH